MPEPAMDSDVRRVARDVVLRDFGITPSRLVRLAHRHNDVFRIDTAAGQRFVLRIQNQLLSDAQVRSQHVWLAALAREQAAVRVPQPVPTSDGGSFAEVDTPNGRRRVVVLSWIPGRIARTRGPRVYAKVARMIARLHLHAEHFRPPRGFACRTLDADWLFGSRCFARHVNRRRRQVASVTERMVRDAMRRLGRGGRHFGVIHADLNLDNIIFHHGEPAPIDFDEFGRGWFLFDLAELIRTSITPQNFPQRKKLAIDAYRHVRSLSEDDVAHFDAFSAATFVQYLNWAFEHARDQQDLRWVGFCIDVLRMLTTRADRSARQAKSH